MRNILKSFILGATAVALISCEPKPHTATLDFAPVLGFENASTKATAIRLQVPEGASVTRTVDFRVMAEAISANMLEVTFKVDPSKIADYNAANGTSYKAAPNDACDVSTAKVTLLRYNKTSTTAHLTFHSSGLPDDDQYLVPVVIASVEGDDAATFSEESGVMYYLLSKRTIPSPKVLDRTGWTILYCSSQNGDQAYKYDGVNTTHFGPVDYMLDGDPLTWWNYNEGSDAINKSPFYIVVDMQKEYFIKAVRLTARHALKADWYLTRGAPKNVNFAFATEAAITGDSTVKDAVTGNFSEYEKFSKITEFQSRTVFQVDLPLTTIYKCRYIKMEYFGGWHYSGCGPAPEYLSADTNYPAGLLAEFEALGYVEDPEKDE